MSTGVSQTFYEHISDQIWTDLKDETGFQDYYENLSTSPKPTLFDIYFKDLAPYHPPFNKPPIACSIVDLCTTGSTVTLQGHDFLGKDDANFTAKEILRSLRQPPQNISLRVVLWRLEEETGVTPELLSVCGLGLKIRPSFFEAVNDITSKNLSTAAAQTLKSWSNPDDPFLPSYTKIGLQIATTAGGYIKDQTLTPTILLIVDFRKINDFRQPLVFDPRASNIGDLQCYTTKAFLQAPLGTLLPHSRIYTNLLEHLLKEKKSGTISTEHLLTIASLPMVYIDSIQMRTKIYVLRCQYLDVPQEKERFVDNNKFLEAWALLVATSSRGVGGQSEKLLKVCPVAERRRIPWLSDLSEHGRDLARYAQRSAFARVGNP